jgi:hypothetical protein
LNVDYNCQIFQNFLNKKYSVDLSKKFRGTTVQLLHRQQHN